MRICSIEGCGRKHYQRGFCKMHWGRWRRNSPTLNDPNRIRDIWKNRTKKTCSLIDCYEPHYVHGFCKNHYEQNKRTGSPFPVNGIRIPCKVSECKNDAPKRSGLCKFHSVRLKVGIPLDAPYHANRKERNGRWNDGISEYPNHSLMKRVRKERLIACNYKCQICGGPAKQVHHLDRSKTNHDPNNILVLCRKCHMGFFHSGKNRKRLQIQHTQRIQQSVNLQPQHSTGGFNGTNQSTRRS